MKAAAKKVPKENPKGIPSQSPGLRGTSYPGESELGNDNPNGVAPGLRPNPVGEDEAEDTLPRVARSSQPWAVRRNPFEIGPKGGQGKRTQR